MKKEPEDAYRLPPAPKIMLNLHAYCWMDVNSAIASCTNVTA